VRDELGPAADKFVARAKKTTDRSEIRSAAIKIIA
jgi:hypothetical protein